MGPVSRPRLPLGFNWSVDERENGGKGEHKGGSAEAAVKGLEDSLNMSPTD